MGRLFNKLIIISFVYAVVSCNQVQDNSVKSTSKSKNIQTSETVTEDGTYIESNGDDETSGVLIYVPNDSSVDAKEIQVQKGASVANNTTASYLKYPGGVEEASVSISVVSSNRFYDQSVGTLQITIPDDNIDAEHAMDEEGAQLIGSRKIALFYHAYTNTKGARVYGVVPSKDLQFTEKGITFNLRGFGNYQLGYVSEELDWSKRVSTSNHIETADGAKTFEQILDNVADRAQAEQEYEEAGEAVDETNSLSDPQGIWSNFTFNLDVAPNPSNIFGASGMFHRSESESSPDGKHAVAGIFSHSSPSMAIIVARDGSNEWKSALGTQWYANNGSFPISIFTTVAITNSGQIVVGTCNVGAAGNATYHVGIVVAEGVTRVQSIADTTSISCLPFKLVAFDGIASGTIQGLFVPKFATYSGMDQANTTVPTQILQFEYPEQSQLITIHFRSMPTSLVSGRKFGFRIQRSTDSVLYSWGSDGNAFGLGPGGGDENKTLSNCGQSLSSASSAMISSTMYVYRHEFTQATPATKLWSGKVDTLPTDLSFHASTDRDWVLSWPHFDTSAADSSQVKSVHSTNGNVIGCTTLQQKGGLLSGAFGIVRVDRGWLSSTTSSLPTSSGALVANHHLQSIADDMTTFSLTGRTAIAEVSEDKSHLISNGKNFAALVTTSNKMMTDGQTKSFINTYLIDPSSSTFSKHSVTVDAFCGNPSNPAAISTASVSCSSRNGDIIRLGSGPSLFILTWPKPQQVKIYRLN